MKDYKEADLAMLEALLEWNDQRGGSVSIELRKFQQQWAVSFYGYVDREYRSLIAQFSGESADVLERWAKSMIWRYKRRKQLK